MHRAVIGYHPVEHAKLLTGCDVSSCNQELTQSQKNQLKSLHAHPNLQTYAHLLFHKTPESITGSLEYLYEQNRHICQT